LLHPDCLSNLNFSRVLRMPESMCAAAALMRLISWAPVSAHRALSL
jgi:hypothetical protein